MSKCLPIEALMMLHNRLACLSQRNPERRLIVTEAAEFYGVSTATIYRAIRKRQKLKITCRSDYNQSRCMDPHEMRQYCELIAALNFALPIKKATVFQQESVYVC